MTDDPREERRKRIVIVGTIGHVGSDRATLTAAIASLLACDVRGVNHGDMVHEPIPDFNYSASKLYDEARPPVQYFDAQRDKVKFKHQQRDYKKQQLKRR